LCDKYAVFIKGKKGAIYKELIEKYFHVSIGFSGPGPGMHPPPSSCDPETGWTVIAGLTGSRSSNNQMWSMSPSQKNREKKIRACGYPPLGLPMLLLEARGQQMTRLYATTTPEPVYTPLFTIHIL
jgi:hypothetical protein